jgi:hypothetical protein
MFRFRLAGVLLVGAALLGAGGAAQATPSTLSAAAGGAAQQAPTGYVVVQSGEVANPDGQQTFGSVSCPAGTVALSGGAVGDSPSVLQRLSGSIPQVAGSVATGWDASMSNTSGSDSSFSVWAVCARKPKQYAVVSQSFDDPAGSSAEGVVECPLNARRTKRLAPLGGGAAGGAQTPGQDIIASLPLAKTRSWMVWMHNSLASDETSQAFAVCGNLPGWTVVLGSFVQNPAGALTQADATCPAGLTALGGGLDGGAHGTFHSTFPAAAADWRSVANNATSSDNTVTPFVVCAD